MADRSPRQCRRLHGLSPQSLEPSPRRHRGNISSGFQPMVADASGIDPPLGGIHVQDRPSTTTEPERKIPVLSRVLFQLEDNIEVEELSEPLATPNSPLPSDHPNVVLYVGTLMRRPSILGHIMHIPSMTTTGSMASTASATSTRTPTSL